MAYLEAFGLDLGFLHMQTFATIIVGAVSVYAVSRCIYLKYFHPLARFPGPPLAAVSNTWYAYHWLSGRYPWAIEHAIHKYGDVVRIAPNELVFLTPQAFKEIYGPQRKNLELFVKTEFNAQGKDLGGIIWEEDPVRHREVAKRLSPAFASRAIREMEPLISEYMDYFVERMKELGGRRQGVGLVDWTNWLAMDISADLSYNERMNEMRDMKNSLTLNVVQAFNRFSTAMQVFQKFPLLSPLQYLLVPFPKLLVLVAMDKRTRQAVKQRIERGSNGTTEHIDFFEYMHPAGSPAPTTEHELTRLGSIAAQVMFAEFGPISDWWYAAIYYLLEEPDCYRLLVEEIRAAFSTYEEIEPRALKSLPYLHACLEESLRLFPSNNTGLPRYSPGAKVDGQFIPKGTTVQTSIFAMVRSPHYFHDPLRFRPQRWLPASHPLYDPAYSNDERDGLFSFSMGPRVCLGKNMAWMQGRLFVAKVLWTFDLTKADPDCHVDLEGKLRHYGFFVKPEVNVRFVLVSR